MKYISTLFFFLMIIACNSEEANDQLNQLNDAIDNMNDATGGNGNDGNNTQVCWQHIHGKKYSSTYSSYYYKFTETHLVITNPAGEIVHNYTAYYGQAPSYHEGQNNSCYTWLKAGNYYYLLKKIEGNKIQVYHKLVGSNANSTSWYTETNN